MTVKGWMLAGPYTIAGTTPLPIERFKGVVAEANVPDPYSTAFTPGDWIQLQDQLYILISVTF